MADGLKKSVRYIDADVYTEAKKRISHIIDTFDKVIVCFSGGKDSLVTLRLTEEIYREKGIQEPVNVAFRDEELIPDDVINFVQWHAKQPQYRFFYYAVQLKSHKFILGRTFEYIQWDESRRWLREKPDNAITAPGRIFDQYSMDAFIAEGHKGKLAFITGIRADESITRFKACVNKKNENYINATQAKNVKLCKPIYDWSEKDIFKYLYEKGIQYCPIYDLQVWNGQGLRVATPLHAEQAKRLGQIKTLCPVFYQQLIDIFPEIIVQERYWNQFDRLGVICRYPRGWNGIAQFIRENLTDTAEKQLAIKRVLEAKRTRENMLAKGQNVHNFGGYPVLYVFRQILAGNFKRAMMPCSNPSKEEIEYEQPQAV